MIVGRIGRTRSSYFIIIFDCLSRERGEKGEAVLQIYCDYACARQWGTWLKEVPNTMERRLQMALNDTFADIAVPELLILFFNFGNKGHGKFIEKQIKLKLRNSYNRPFPHGT